MSAQIRNDETWRATMGLRMFMLKGGLCARLQQDWISNSCEVEWRDVEKVYEDEADRALFEKPQTLTQPTKDVQP